MENPIPRDILDKINSSFTNATDAYEAHTLLAGLWQRGLNVGPGQLARSMLYISNGDINKLRHIFENDFYGDPRDLITEAPFGGKE